MEPGALSDEAAVSLAKELRKGAALGGATVLVGRRADIARAAAADGVLVGPGDLSPGEARRVLGQGAIVGLKVPGAEEGRAAFDAGATFVIVPFAGIRGVPPDAEDLWFASALAPEHLDTVIEAGVRRIALGLPDSPEEAERLVRAARDALRTGTARDAAGPSSRDE